jgi:hypothetical protein
MIKKDSIKWAAVWKIFSPGTAMDMDHATTIPMAEEISKNGLG